MKFISLDLFTICFRIQKEEKPCQQGSTIYMLQMRQTLSMDGFFVETSTRSVRCIAKIQLLDLLYKISAQALSATPPEELS
ncbi:hypothetical protein ALC57_08037 [Trachymyrmex cornetzi]|uniref:Uncharacterized protein n=1 Tax=Trachymyrmex cornetzi TaxID=471704 RepID=A0A195E3A6_9HYME|nr:hypothetical protein ALC57_08037 [Trachymyrmex cornetzi]